MYDCACGVCVCICLCVCVCVCITACGVWCACVYMSVCMYVCVVYVYVCVCVSTFSKCGLCCVFLSAAWPESPGLQCHKRSRVLFPAGPTSKCGCLNSAAVVWNM